MRGREREIQLYEHLGSEDNGERSKGLKVVTRYHSVLKIK